MRISMLLMCGNLDNSFGSRRMHILLDLFALAPRGQCTSFLLGVLVDRYTALYSFSARRSRGQVHGLVLLFCLAFSWTGTRPCTSFLLGVLVDRSEGRRRGINRPRRICGGGDKSEVLGR